MCLLDVILKRVLLKCPYDQILNVNFYAENCWSGSTSENAPFITMCVFRVAFIQKADYQLLNIYFPSCSGEMISLHRSFPPSLGHFLLDICNPGGIPIWEGCLLENLNLTPKKTDVGVTQASLGPKKIGTGFISCNNEGLWVYLFSMPVI